MNRKFWIGLVLILASFGQWLVPHDWAIENHFAAGFPFTFAVAFFSFGTIFLCEGIVQKAGGTSLLSLARGGGKGRVIQFLLIAALTGIVLEVFAQWLGKLWHYAYYPEWFYWPSLIPSFALYWVVIVETYMAAKALLDRVIHQGGVERRPLKYFSFESTLYIAIGTLGAGLFMFGTLRAVLSYVLDGGYEFNPYSPVDFAPALGYILMACLGLWLLFEAISYVRQSNSLIRTTLHGYLVPVLAILLASVVWSLVWEGQNSVVDYWVYDHWPWENLRLFDIEFSVFVTWPLHYLGYLAMPAALVPAWAAAFFNRPQSIKVKEKVTE